MQLMSEGLTFKKKFNANLVTDRLIENQILWKNRSKSRPTSAIVKLTESHKKKSDEFPGTNQLKGKLSDYIPTSKHLVDSMQKAFGKNLHDDFLSTSKYSSSKLISMTRQQSKPRISGSQKLLQNFAAAKQSQSRHILLARPLKTPSTTQREFNLRKQLQDMKAGLNTHVFSLKR